MILTAFEEFTPIPFTYCAPSKCRERTSTAKSFALDVSETEKEYTVHAELPGFDKSSIDIHLEDGILTIQAEKTQEETEENKKWHIRERVQSKVSRSLRFPLEISEPSASYENGILTITIPKSEKKDNRIKVTIN
jgi:HSP20 family protein